uniref:Protein kinase domain-containing protein n=1 Tax=Romanomermis culicivorax TaxID=13658 RepID=A0A915L6Y3_ROMCU
MSSSEKDQVKNADEEPAPKAAAAEGNKKRSGDVGEKKKDSESQKLKDKKEGGSKKGAAEVKKAATKKVAEKPMPNVKEGEVVNNRFTIVKLLGAGGFGAVYEVDDAKTKQKAAMKLELHKPPPDHPDLTLEMNVLRRVQKNVHFTRFIQNGVHRNIRYLVMQLVGRNLGDMRKSCPDKKFTYSSAHRSAMQMFEAIEHMHKVELLHRDIKPGNYAVGYTRGDVRMIYLLDFGLVRKYTAKNGKVRPQRAHAPFRGTRRYASPNMLKEIDSGRVDDLISWIYSVVECSIGNLPFPSTETNRKKLADIKLQVAEDAQGLFKDMHKIWRPIYDHLMKLKYADVPDYAMIRREMDGVLKEKKIDFKRDPYDWEEEGGTFSKIITQTMAKGPPKKSADEMKEKFATGTTGKDTGGGAGVD